MLFEEYYSIMKEHGIGEFIFLFNDKEYMIITEFDRFDIYYQLISKNIFQTIEDLDELVNGVFFESKSLREIWDEIEILFIDGVAECDYDKETCSFNYVKSLQENGELQWSYYHSPTKSFFVQLQYAILGFLPFPILSALIPLFGQGNWNTVLLFSFGALFALIVGIIVLLRNKLSINYQITTKKIFVFNGLEFQTDYQNIKKVKLKKSIFKKNYGTIKVYVKKGFSLNYILQDIPNPQMAYDLIKENISKINE